MKTAVCDAERMATAEIKERPLSSLLDFGSSDEPTNSSRKHALKRRAQKYSSSSFRPRDELWKLFDTSKAGTYSCNLCAYTFRGRPSTTVARRHIEKRHNSKGADDFVSTLFELGSLFDEQNDAEWDGRENPISNQHNGSTTQHQRASKQNAAKMSSEKPIAQGKTKAIFRIADNPANVRIKSLDSLTAFNAKRRDEIEGKAEAASKTTCNVFRFLNECGIRTHFVREISGTEFEAKNCQMVPIEWVARRVATGSFLKRNPGVSEGYTFTPPLIETFFKDDANDDPQWSEAQILMAGFEFNGRRVGKHEYDWMRRSTSTIFRILERAWARQGCVLVDMKIEFGVTTEGEVVLADVIDNDSWRVWPNGDRRLQLDKQFYRDLPQVTDDALKELKKNYDRVETLTREFLTQAARPRAVIIMGSASDKSTAEKIASGLRPLGVDAILRISSAHKSTHETLALAAEYEDDPTPTVFIAIAGRSNGLGPVLASNTVLPVINAPPITPEWAAQDIWSSLRMPAGVGVSTVLGTDEAALAAAKMFSGNNHIIYGKLLATQLNNVGKILDSDRCIIANK